MKKSIQLATVLTTRLSCFTTLLLSLLVAANASATVVTNNTQSALMTALAGGGTVTFGIDGTFNLTNTLVIATNVTLDGAGHTISISGSNAVRIFLVNSGVTFTLKNLALINGYYTATDPYNLDGGAALYNTGTASAINCVFSNNAVLGTNTGTYATSAAGGAIANQAGTLNLTNCTFLTNSATGGPHYGPYPYFTTYVGHGLGGAICNWGGTVNLNGDFFDANDALGGREALGSDTAGQLGSGFGGGLYSSNGVTLIVGCWFTSNSALATVSHSGASSENGGVGVGGAVSMDRLDGERHRRRCTTWSDPAA